MPCAAGAIGRDATACGKSEEPAGGTGSRSTFGNRTGGWDWRLAVLRVDFMR